jgi:molybdopterin-guanine dinucleotide biosynthesis protein A
MGYSGAVLAGGASKRFGEDKALFPYRGKPLLQWVLESLQGAEERFVVANRPYEGFGVPVHPNFRPVAESLPGLQSALSHARHPSLAVDACGLPLLRRDYWRFLYEKAFFSPYPVVVAYSGQGPLFPLVALHHKDCLSHDQGLVREGVSLLLRVPGTLGASHIPFAFLARFGERVVVDGDRGEELN